MLERVPIRNSINFINYETIEIKSKKNGDFTSFLHIVCTIAGAGILQLPYALKQGGFITVLSILLSGFFLYYVGKLMNKCMNHKSKEREFGYKGILDLAEYLFSHNGRLVIQAITGAMVIGSCALYLILSSINLTMMFPNVSLNWSMIVLIISCVPFIMMKTLKEAKILSIFGVLSTVIMVTIIIFICYVDFSNLKVYPYYKFIDLPNIPIAYASISFAMSGNIIFPHIEDSMENPKNFDKVLKYSIAFITSTFSVIALIGYMAYGNMSASPIFNNMKINIFVAFALLMLTLHMIVTIPIFLTTFSSDIEETLKINHKINERIYRYIIRTSISFGLFFISVNLPYFPQIASLMGALCGGILVFFIPPIFYIKLFSWEYINLSDKIIIISLFVIGSFVTVIGTYQSLIDLYNAIS